MRKSHGPSLFPPLSNHSAQDYITYLHVRGEDRGRVRVRERHRHGPQVHQRLLPGHGLHACKYVCIYVCERDG